MFFFSCRCIVLRMNNGHHLNSPCYEVTDIHGFQQGGVEAKTSLSGLKWKRQYACV